MVGRLDNILLWAIILMVVLLKYQQEDLQFVNDDDHYDHQLTISADRKKNYSHKRLLLCASEILLLALARRCCNLLV